MKTSDPKATALITGATSGIGLHLAHVFARNGHHVVLVAPDRAELETIAGDIRARFGVGAEIIAADLTRIEDPAATFGDVAGRVGILCNNAGHGTRGRFEEIPVEKHLAMIALNIEAVVRLTAFFLPRLIARGSGRVLNTASIAGFEPGPTLATYHATKAFVLSLTESLATENAETGVTFTALCPGPVDTDFFEKAGMPESFAFQKANLMAPQEVAEAAYRAAMDGERVVVPGALNKINVFSRRLTPESAQAKINEKLYADVPPHEHKRDRGDKERPAEARHGH